MEISYLGHSCFKIRGRDASVVTDPFGKGLGLPTQVPSRFTADIVTISHDHLGHNNLAMVGGDPHLVNGPGEYEIRGVNIQGVAAYHDDAQGVRLGRVTLYAIAIDDIVLAHLGDLGHSLSEEQLARLGAVDILLIPVGGGNALAATQAAAVANQLEPKVVIPMHYKLPGLKVELDDPKHFASEMGLETVNYEPRFAVSGKITGDEMKVLFLEARAAQTAAVV
jgi:L-ascorbate metabolism protein UlaG (beta-lactamase superfamily)